MKITIVGTGYVGLSNAVLLSQRHTVSCLDINADKINMINSRISPLEDKEIEHYFKNVDLNLHATNSKELAYKDSEFIIISTPTDYDEEIDYFDTTSIENVIQDVLEINPKASIIIKSTIPLGYTSKLRKNFNKEDIYFSPEFLREGRALRDNLYPSRIIVGGLSDRASKFADLMFEASLDKNVKVLLMDSTEAEAVKLFSNSYLALRVSYFNEIDSYAEFNNLDSKQIIEGVSLDPRVGNFYNNPSFGYGGYCLPKDTKQLKVNFVNVKNSIISSIVEANSVRKDFIASRIMERDPATVGIYRLVMKHGSDNHRASAIQGIIARLLKNRLKIYIYEPSLSKEGMTNFMGCDLINNLQDFKSKSEIIVTNRLDQEINDVKDKVYTRDIFNSD